MSDDNRPPVLADLAALRVSGPTLVFVRPRRDLGSEALTALAANLEILSKHLGNRTPEFTEVEFVCVPHDLDLMVLGDADLRRYGLARLPTEGAPV